MTLPKHAQDVLSDLLPCLGLSASEAAVFTHLMTTADAERVSAVAKKTKLNRTTLYGNLKTLSEKGLISSTREGGALMYRAMQPHLLLDHIERAKNDLTARAEKVREIVPVIEKVRSKSFRAYPTIQYFEGKEGIKQACMDTIVGNPSKQVVGFTGTDAAYKVMGKDWVTYFIDQRTRAQILWRTAAIATDESRKMKARDGQESRVTKLLPPGFTFDIEITTYENKVLITSFAEDHPLALIIEDAKIAKTMKEIFRYVDSTLAA